MEPDLCYYAMRKRNCGIDGLKFISIEKFSTLLLNDMLNSGSVDFTTTKTKLGSCFTCDCCNKRNGKTACRLYRYKKTSKIKANNLWNNTYAKSLVTSHLKG
jgi:hypothetical protein